MRRASELLPLETGLGGHPKGFRCFFENMNNGEIPSGKTIEIVDLPVNH
jgi:hypothetical protein